METIKLLEKDGLSIETLTSLSYKTRDMITVSEKECVRNMNLEK